MTEGARNDVRKWRFLIAGLWNTLFGYVAGIVIYWLIGKAAGVIVVGILGSVVSISMAFLTHKLFVFRTKGNWLSEYLRSYVVYGGTAIAGIALLFLFVDILGIEFWLAQLLAILVTVTASYLGHSRFTFRSGNRGDGSA